MASTRLVEGVIGYQETKRYARRKSPPKPPALLPSIMNLARRGVHSARPGKGLVWANCSRTNSAAAIHHPIVHFTGLALFLKCILQGGFNLLRFDAEQFHKRAHIDHIGNIIAQFDIYIRLFDQFLDWHGIESDIGAVGFVL